MIFLRIPSLYEPYWHRDEGITLVVGQALKNGAKLYADIADNKTPFLYYLSSQVNSLYDFKMILLFWQICFAVFFYFALRLFVVKKTNLILMIVVIISFNTPLIEGNIINGEIFFVLPVIIGTLLFWYNFLHHQKLYLIGAGLCFSFAFLFKQAAIFEFFAVLAYILLTQEKRIQKIFLLVISFLTPVILILFYFKEREILGDFLNYAFIWNYLYSSYNNFFIFPYGKIILLIIFLLLSLGLIILQRKKNYIGMKTTYLIIWLIFAFIGSQISQRGYVHYYIPIFTPLILLGGRIYYQNKKIFLVFFIVFIVMINHLKLTDIKYNLNYYKNFWDFQLGLKNKISYNNFFDPTSQRNYEIANYLNSRQIDSIFVWGDEPFFYYLAKKKVLVKFPVAYNIAFRKERITQAFQKINQSPPDLILVIEPVKFPFPQLFKLISEKYRESDKIKGVIIYERKI